MNETRRYRAIWISDVHLGTRGCKTEYLLDFLRRHESETLYLVGDIIDGWKIRRSWGAWTQGHNDVIQKVLRKVRKGTHVLYIPGNHDEMAREFLGMQFGGVSVVAEAVHETADGRRFLVTHGDRYDTVIHYAPWLARLGSVAYDAAIVVNEWFNALRRTFGYPYWSLSGYLKRRVKNAGEFVDGYRRALIQEAARKGLDGVICGHIHQAEHRVVDGLEYVNDGDWVESCTALVEHDDGRLEIVHWADVLARELSDAGSDERVAETDIPEVMVPA